MFAPMIRSAQCHYTPPYCFTNPKSHIGENEVFFEEENIIFDESG